jgi:hypothetical protein
MVNLGVRLGKILASSCTCGLRYKHITIINDDHK